MLSLGNIHSYHNLFDNNIDKSNCHKNHTDSFCRIVQTAAMTTDIEIVISKRTRLFDKGSESRLQNINIQQNNDREFTKRSLCLGNPRLPMIMLCNLSSLNVTIIDHQYTNSMPSIHSILLVLPVK